MLQLLEICGSFLCGLHGAALVILDRGELAAQ